MNESESSLSWQQHYPTYRFSDKDVLLKEFDCAARNVESNERIFLGLINLILLASTALISIGVAFLSKPSQSNLATIIPASGITSLLLTGALFSLLSLRHFADRHKSVVFDSRKVVVLRRMLSLDYGRLQLILPRNRLEGATNPFTIKMFPGWFSPASYPLWIVGAFTTLILFNAWPHISVRLFSQSALFSGIPNGSGGEALTISLTWFIVLALTLRQSLLDTNERLSLLVAQCLAVLLNVKLVPDFEDVLYRARLAAYEAERLKIDTKAIKPVLIFIEDREFLNHAGISWRGIGRACLGLIGRRRKSGGSTITQQLARSLFIVDLNKKIRRKLIEIFIAKWMETILTKEEILNLYLGAVRFDNGVYGLPAAHKHFFPNKKWQLIGKPEAFFLVERVSNISGVILADKIAHTLRQLVNAQILTATDVSKLKLIYENSVKSGRIKDSGFNELSTQISAMGESGLKS